VLAEILAVSITSLNVMEMLVFSGISEDESSGLIDETVGAVTSAVAFEADGVVDTELLSSSLHPTMLTVMMNIKNVMRNMWSSFMINMWSSFMIQIDDDTEKTDIFKLGRSFSRNISSVKHKSLKFGGLSRTWEI
jgi:hypothetical protein